MLRFREVFELWRKDNLFEQAVKDFREMLENTCSMYEEAVKSLRDKDDGEISDEVYRRDIEINRYEQEVRNKILKHLAITGGANLIPGLILTSIIIDAERIGDYTKNIVDLANAHPKKLKCGKYEKEVKKIENECSNLFREVIAINETSNKIAAQQIIAEKKWVVKKCDEIIGELIREERKIKSAGVAVTTALYIRYLKRIAAHLINILTSIVSPFEKIGFLSEPNKDKLDEV
jgi:phosphate transport system protein